jgi:hypothetical protein
MAIEKTAIEQCVTQLQKSFDEFITDNKSAHEKILEQTTKTNGNVRGLQLWKAKMVGAIAVISLILTAIIIPIALTFYKSLFVK